MTRNVALLVLAGAFLSGMTTYAHHSQSAQYDTSQQVTIEGTLVQFQFRNPHTFVPRISDWLWYFCPCDQSSRLDFRGFLERNQATEGDTQWVNYKPRPFSSRSTGF